ncbi:MAG: helix-turn-helix transcriptional regulator [Lentisphaerae bacterium]|nr:helix-turn-helix transcriptional regulator [Lentisphaerota bacterium]
MPNNTYDLKNCSRFLNFPLPVSLVVRRSSNRYRHYGRKLTMIHLCFVLAEEDEEILELDGVRRFDSNPPFMRVTYPGMIARHLRSSLRNELYFAYDASCLQAFKEFGFYDCNFKLTERFSGLLAEVEKLLPLSRSPGMADRLDRLAVMLGLEAMLSALEMPEVTLDSSTERIRQVEKFFQFHYAENFELRDILPRFGMSLRTFYREWKTVFPQSPAEYLLNLRMQEARQLLRTTSLRIYEVADACGYPNVIYFSRVFAKSNGMTPQAYRKFYLNK